METAASVLAPSAASSSGAMVLAERLRTGLTEYKATYNYLFDKEDNLFYRDHRYFTMKEANGAKVFWG